MDTLKMQKLAGLITESEYREKKTTEEAEAALRKTIKEAVAALLEKKKDPDAKKSDKKDEPEVEMDSFDIEPPAGEDSPEDMFGGPEMPMGGEGSGDINSAIDDAMNAIETSATDLSPEDRATLLRLQGNVQAFYNKKKTKAAVSAVGSGQGGRDISF
jgi:hypothetical protein